MRLVACSKCHTQFDVTGRDDSRVKCHCGEWIEVHEAKAVDAQITRCGACGAPIASDSINCEYCGGVIVRDRKRLGLVCPECYARNDNDSHFCTSCGVEFSPEAIPEDGEARPCPCDGTEMAIRSISGVRVQECVTCLGMWVPEDHFDRLIQKAVKAHQDCPSAGLGLPDRQGRKADFSARIEYRPCPVCGDMMNRKNFDRRSGVIIDICADHGVWLDADELEDIASYIAERGMHDDQPGRSSNQAVNTAEALLMVESIKTREKSRSFVRQMTSVSDVGAGGIFSMGRLLQRLLGI